MKIKLLRDGATPAFSHTDIMFPYYSQYSHKLKMLNFASEVDVYADEKQEISDNTNKKVKKSSGKAKEKKLSPLMYILSILFICKYIFLYFF